MTLRVVIVGGLHGEARRSAVRDLLTAVPRSVALHHDLATAAEGTVRRLVHDASGELSRGEAPLVGDCACCALREDLLPELWRLASDGRTRLAVVELWDSVDPRAMAEVVTGHGGEALALTNVITAVDPALVLPYLANGDDLADVGLAAAPTARRVHTGSGELARLAFAGFDTEAAAAAQHPACALLPQEADEAGVATLVWRRHRPFHPERLHQALEDLAAAATRSRGRFWLADRPDTLLAWDCAGGALCVQSNGPWLASLPDAAWELVPPVRRAAAALGWHPEHGDRCQHLVFTAPDLDR
ncbi:cobalamin biosynthesis protein CobW [Streptomyces avidinii]|uniref:G3E family GTPase n=1 Tax=Streptomyces avidinii TaxID=1895 RepID=A0ABS4KX71_STRAV|nr:G3E family GTPase [Streptomyces avidinii]GGY87718.1 cobalamin biosynthesis protein CobW [Streptomyces avidinii]